MIRAYKILSIAIAFPFIFPTFSFAGQFKVTYVYDGDTLIAKGHDIEIKVGLAGIDAPETPMREPYAAKAKKHLAKMVLNKTVDIRGYGLGLLTVSWVSFT
jgi:endonuclease YncB( thermonuclease family)